MVRGSDEDVSGSIGRVRAKFLEEAGRNPHFFDVVDIDRVRTDDYTVKRYVQHHHGDEEKGFDMLLEAMKWRKSFGVNSITAVDFPKEYFMTGEAHKYVNDKNGVCTVYLRVKHHKKINEVNSLSQKFLVYMLETCENEGRKSGKGYGLIWDCLGGTLFNVDLELLRFLTNTWTYYYTGGTKYIVLYELPWILRAIYRLVRSWLPEDLREIIQFTDRAGIKDVIGSEYLPDYLGGECKVNYKTAPSQCKPMRDMVVKEILPEEAYKKFMGHYKSYLPKESDNNET